VELAEPAAEAVASAADDAAPLLADEGGVDEARGVVRREADEDLLHDLLRQRRRRRHEDRSATWVWSGEAAARQTTDNLLLEGRGKWIGAQQLANASATVTRSHLL